MRIIRSALAANPKIDLTMLADQLGISRGQIYYYTSERIKGFAEPPFWAADLFAACCSLSQHDDPAAVAAFRRLADAIEARSKGPIP